MLWRFVLLLTVVLGTISTFTVQQREAFRQSVCTLSKRSTTTSFHDRVDWATTTAVALASTVVIWIGCRIWLGDIHVKLTLPLDFNVKSAKSFLQMVHFYKSLSVELFRKKNPLVLFQSGRKTSAGTEIALPNSKIEDDDVDSTIFLNDHVVSDCKMMEDSVFRSQRELILNLQEHLNSVNEQKKAMKQRLDLTLRYQKSCQRELEITKQQLATTNSQLEYAKQSLEEKTNLMESMERDLTSAYYNRKTLIRQVELLKVELMSLKSKAFDGLKDDISLEIPECKTQRGKLDLRRVRKTFKKLDRSITESLSKMKIQPASWTDLCNSDDERSVFQERSAEIYEVPVERLPVPSAMTPVEHDVEWQVAWTETESLDSLVPENEQENPLQNDELGAQETPVSTNSDSDSVEDKPMFPSGISLIVDAIMRCSGSSRESSSSERRHGPERYQEDRGSSGSEVEERENERMITGSPAFQKLLESFMSQTAVN